jgi:hypothetical protein
MKFFQIWALYDGNPYLHMTAAETIDLGKYSGR